MISILFSGKTGPARAFSLQTLSIKRTQIMNGLAFSAVRINHYFQAFVLEIQRTFHRLIGIFQGVFIRH